ncbi:uncharacterized protein LOC142093079 [Calonectris borealis]|uniref:uncharacterized protein LOC142093079 n=1 Tax=Calonectris borealis TaxID=1323832 RepID=UPI003F4B68AA
MVTPRPETPPLPSTALANTGEGLRAWGGTRVAPGSVHDHLHCTGVDVQPAGLHEAPCACAVPGRGLQLPACPARAVRWSRALIGCGRYFNGARGGLCTQAAAQPSPSASREENPAWLTPLAAQMSSGYGSSALRALMRRSAETGTSSKRKKTRMSTAVKVRDGWKGSIVVCKYKELPFTNFPSEWIFSDDVLGSRSHPQRDFSLSLEKKKG